MAKNGFRRLLLIRWARWWWDGRAGVAWAPP